MNKLSSVQALRALAALMVVILHSKIMFSAEERKLLLTIPGFTDIGYYGVQLFFVISGFIISVVVSKPNYDVRSFAIRRVFRIFPLWWLVMSVGLAMYFWRSWFRADVELLGLVGVLKSYALLPQKPYPFINPGWSLEYEVIFYAIVALLYPLTGIWGVFVLMLGLSTAANAFKPADGYHLVDGSYLFFGAGIVAYLLRNRSWREAAPLAAGGLALAYARFYEAIPIGINEAMVALATGFAALLVVVVSLERNGWSVPRFIIRIGDASYSLYLWHWLLIPSLATVRNGLFADRGSPELWRWIFIFISIAVAQASFRWLELPSIALGDRLSRRIAGDRVRELG